MYSQKEKAMTSHPLLEQLHDIAGLDPVSSWPLATGWWALLAIAVLSVAAILGYGIYWLTFKRSWKYDAIQKLEALEKNLTDATLRDTALALSEYLRRIALKRFSRKECAALMGDAWLLWLTQNDPKKFDWNTKGAVLLELAYARSTTAATTAQVQELIKAARGWVR
jgi:hypothetical protein